MRLDWFKPGGWASLVILGVCAFALTTVGVSREVPVGSVSGRVLMPLNRSPLPNADVILSLQGESWSDERIFRAKTDEDGEFSLRGVPADKYVMQVYGRVHQASTPIEIKEGETVTREVMTTRTNPYVEMNAGSRVFTPDEEIRLRFSGLSDEANLEVVVHEVTPLAIGASRNLGNLLYGIASGINRNDPKSMVDLKETKRDAVAIDTRDIEGVFVKEHTVSGLAKGVYLVEGKTKESRAFAWLTVTTIGLVTATDSDSGVAYVTDLKTGEPLDGAKVVVRSVGGNTETLTEGGAAAIGGWKSSAQSPLVLVSAMHEGSPAYSWFYSYGTEASGYQATTVLDRTVYRPGDQVHVKTTVRQKRDGEFVVPAPQEARFELFDGYGVKMDERPATVDEMGTAVADFELPVAGDVGGHSVELVYGSTRFSKTVPVAAYRKPSFEVKVTPEKESYVRGETIRFVIQCTSLTGEPVPGARIDATLNRSQTWYGSPFDEDYDPYWEEDYGYEGEYLGSYEAMTDEAGRAVVTVDTRQRQGRDADYVDYRYSLSASVEDAGGRYYYGEGKVPVRRGEVELRAEMGSSFVGEGDAVEVKIEALGDANRLSGAVEVQFGRMVYGRSDMSFDVEGRRSATLSPDSPTSTMTFEPRRAGSYVVRVSGVDRSGNKVASEEWLWVSGVGAGGTAELPDLRVIPSKDAFLPGETAEFLVQTSQPGGSALVVVDMGDFVRHEVVALDGLEAKVSFEVEDRFAPNMFVSAVRVHGKRFAQASRSVRVGLDRRELTVTVRPDRTDVRPGETVNYDVETTDSEGRPVAADVAFGVVDEGIYLLRPDRYDPLDEFYPRRWSGVTISHSFPEIYLDGEDKSGAEIEVRQTFLDTAFWRPRLRTDSSGRASVAVTLPDNLTTWRATAYAISADTRIGKGTADVVARKPVMARLSLPSFLVEGDEQEITGYVVNGTDQPQSVTVRLLAVGGTLSGPAAQDLEIGPDGTGKVIWTVSPTEAGRMTFRLTAEGASESDGVELSVPVKTLGVAVRDARSDRLSAGQETAMDFSFAEPLESGELTVTVSPNLVQALEGSLDELVDYPYGCLEQTMSRFVPGVLVRDYMRSQGIVRPELEAKIDDVTAIGLARVRALQHWEGHWGWFEHSEPDEAMTALALDGLRRARAAGVAVPDEIVTKGLAGATELLKATISSNELSYRYGGRLELASAVLQYQPSEIAETRLRELSRRTDLSVRDSASMVLGWEAVLKRAPGNNSARQLRDAAFRSLLEKGFSGGATLTFGDARDGAAALEAILAVEGASERADRVMASLMQSRQGRGWSDTWRTNRALTAAVTYLRVTGGRPVSGWVELVVEAGGETVRRRIDLGTVAETVSVPLREGVRGAVVRANMDGEGQPFLSAEVRGEAAVSDPAPVSRPSGFVVKREFFKMETTRLENGRLARIMAKRPTTVFQAGDVLRVRLTLDAPADVEYVMVEDPIPSSFRIVDVDEPEAGWGWSNWWDKSSFFDDRAVFFISRLAAGKSVIEYAVRAEAPGVGTALSTRAAPMYQPDAEARGRFSRVEVRR